MVPALIDVSPCVSNVCTLVEKEPLSTFKAANLVACEADTLANEPVIPKTNPYPEPPTPFPNRHSTFSIL